MPKVLDGEKSGGSRRSNIEKELERKGIIEIEMPPCQVQYLISYLFEIGPTTSTGEGFVPLSHAEIMAWQSNIGIELQPWEARVLKRLSNEYLGESYLATEPDAYAPWQDAPYYKKPLMSLEAMRQRNALKKLANL